jgi:hypothetical protein
MRSRLFFLCRGLSDLGRYKGRTGGFSLGLYADLCFRFDKSLSKGEQGIVADQNSAAPPSPAALQQSGKDAGAGAS